MKFLWRLAALPLTFALILPAAAPAQNSNPVTVFVNGQQMQFDQPPVVQGGRVFVPMRAVFQQLGATVVYNNGQINATGNGRTISLTIGSTTAYINGQQQILDQAPFTVGDRTLVPLRFIAQSLGAYVNWDASSNSVTITRGGGNSGPPPPRPPPPMPPPPPPNVGFVSNSPTGTIYNNQPLIAFQLTHPARIALFSVSVDGTRVPANSISQVSNASFSFRVPAMNPGRHTVRVWGRTTDGYPFDRTWTFVTSGPTPAPSVSFVAKSPTGTILNRQPSVSFQFNRPSRVNLIRVTVDGNNIPRANINQPNDTSFNFNPNTLTSGRHVVRVWGQTVGGITFDLNWAFNVR